MMLWPLSFKRGTCFQTLEQIDCLQPKQLVVLMVESSYKQAALICLPLHVCSWESCGRMGYPSDLASFVLSPHQTTCDGKSHSRSLCRCNLPLISNPSPHFVLCFWQEGLNLMHTFLGEPQLEFIKVWLLYSRPLLNVPTAHWAVCKIERWEESQ